MKKPLLRELLLLSLPSLLIAGAVLWKTGGQALWQNATLPRVDIGPEGITLDRVGPLASQNEWNDEDFDLFAGLTIHDPLRRTHGVAPVDVSHNQFIDQKGQPISPTPFTYSYFPGSYASPNWLVKKYPQGSTLVLACDLDRVPLSRGEVTLRARWVLPDNRFQPFSVVVRPAWFCRPPRTLHLKSSRWLPQVQDLPGEHEGVEIVVRADGKTANLATDEQFSGSRVAWNQHFLNNPSTVSVIRPHLLFNWAPRFQSNDGRYDSHDARDARVWAAVNAQQRNSLSRPYSVRPLLDGFKPSVRAELPERHGNTFKIVYYFDGLRSEPRAQQFITDIGVPGDGFLRVKVPVPPRKRN